MPAMPEPLKSIGPAHAHPESHCVMHSVLSGNDVGETKQPQCTAQLVTPGYQLGTDLPNTTALSLTLQV